MGNKAILLVDDDESILLPLGNYLERNNFRVQTANSGESALSLFRTTFFDLIITDLVMDGISGIKVLQEVKKINSGIGVLILTGQCDLTLAIEALRSGADDFLMKPCDADELILRMERVLEKQEVMKKNRIYEKLIPICMYCKKIRDDTGTQHGAGRWLQLEEYLSRKSGADLTHGCCPECHEEFVQKWQKIP
jgi:DNA-binding NtrC family response regulator